MKNGEWTRVAALCCISFALSCAADSDKSAEPAPNVEGSSKATSPQQEQTGASSAHAQATADQGRGEGEVRGPDTRAPQAIPSGWGENKGGASRPTMLAAVAFDLEGKLSAEDVRKTIDESRDKFSRCLSGDSTVSVKAKVMTSGALSDISVPSSVPNDAKLRDCVVAVLKTLTFPKPKGVEPAGLRLDLALKKQLSF